ncbi:MAG: prohibitin family protein [Cystobacterineae bacterium]|nr:prohibitin family protein [Cystobacterineae bacterium]
MPNKSIFISAVVPIALFVGAILVYASASVVQPGNRGVQVTFGEVNANTLEEGLHFINPVSVVKQVSIRQKTDVIRASSFSSDLQNINVTVKILHKIPESSVVRIFTNYAGDPFESLIAPRVQEAVKESTAMLSAEQIAKSREEVKQRSLELSRKKIGELLMVEDLVIEDIVLTPELQKAIEAKMVQEQEAGRAHFFQRQAETEAQTAVIRAKGDADALKIRGDALKQNPQVLQMNLIEKWNGVSPLVIGAGSQGASFILPLDKN